MNHPESKLQENCVKWFRLQYPEYSYLLIAIPNGGKRNIETARTLKREGVVAGVADMLLLVPNQYRNILAIEMKAGKNTLTPAQEQWKLEFERFAAHKYVICRSFDDFMNVINSYLE